MSTWKAPPAILQNSAVRCSAYVDGQDTGRTRARRRFTSRDQVWSWSAYRVLDNVCDETCEGDADDEAQYRDMRLMKGRSRDKRVYYEEYEWADASIDDVLERADSLDLCKRVGNAGIGQGEVALEWDDEEFALDNIRQYSVKEIREMLRTPKYATCNST